MMRPDLFKPASRNDVAVAVLIALLAVCMVALYLRGSTIRRDFQHDHSVVQRLRTVGCVREDPRAELDCLLARARSDQLARFRGPPGPAGRPGSPGSPGAAGSAGPAGTPGPTGTSGAQGGTGPQGARGPAGPVTAVPAPVVPPTPVTPPGNGLPGTPGNPIIPPNPVTPGLGHVCVLHLCVT